GSHVLIATTAGGALSAGGIWSLPSCLKTPLAQHVRLHEKRAHVLGAVAPLGLVLTMLVSGTLIDKWGVQAVLLGGLLLTALALIGLECSRSWRTAVLVLLGLGAAGACVASASVLLMPRAFFPRNPVASTNLGFVFFTLGALAAPAL